jgi:hypothetical protein
MPCRSSTEGHALGAETGDAGLFGVFAVFADTGLAGETGDTGELGVFAVLADTGELGVLGVLAEAAGVTFVVLPLVAGAFVVAGACVVAAGALVVAAGSLVAALRASGSTTIVVSVGTGTDSMRLVALGDGVGVSADAPPAATAPVRAMAPSAPLIIHVLRGRVFISSPPGTGGDGVPPAVAPASRTLMRWS